MRSSLYHRIPLLALVLLFGLAACSDSTPSEPTTGQLVVSASTQAPPGSFSAMASSAVPVGDPARWDVGLYSFHISPNADCSSPVVAFDNGSTPVARDFTTSPELFRADDLPLGTYPCVAMKISDVLSYQSSVTSGACAIGVTYTGDVYRAGGEDEPFRDLSLAAITATGSDETPSEDGIFLIFTTNKPAAEARGFASNQVIPLSSALVVPDAVTFYWPATNAIADDDGRCLLEPGTPGLFR